MVKDQQENHTSGPVVYCILYCLISNILIQYHHLPLADPLLILGLLSFPSGPCFNRRKLCLVESAQRKSRGTLEHWRILLCSARLLDSSQDSAHPHRPVCASVLRLESSSRYSLSVPSSLPAAGGSQFACPPGLRQLEESWITVSGESAIVAGSTTTRVRPFVCRG